MIYVAYKVKCSFSLKVLDRMDTYVAGDFKSF